MIGEVHHQLVLWQLQQHPGNLLCQVLIWNERLDKHIKLLAVHLKVHLTIVRGWLPWCVHVPRHALLHGHPFAHHAHGHSFPALAHAVFVALHALAVLALPAFALLAAFAFALALFALSFGHLFRPTLREGRSGVQGALQELPNADHLQDVAKEVAHCFLGLRNEHLGGHPLYSIDLFDIPLDASRCQSKLLRRTSLRLC
mmetsp:Transcript_58335/g.126109  ORF Transcript_58335/g.126109 Transcript_58335/m.126109 type:complete len:200 (+) Transcript_58335:350-949(+)